MRQETIVSRYDACMPATDNAALARAWLRAFNAHDVAALVALYDERAAHTSPKLRVQSPETGGKVVGRDALRAWWEGAIARVPGLRYEETSITASDERVFLEYVRHAAHEAPMLVAEVFDVAGGRIVASRVYHG
jgi:limonene-1,2-epoxide hydrolase